MSNEGELIQLLLDPKRKPEWALDLGQSEAPTNTRGPEGVVHSRHLRQMCSERGTKRLKRGHHGVERSWDRGKQGGRGDVKHASVKRAGKAAIHLHLSLLILALTFPN